MKLVQRKTVYTLADNIKIGDYLQLEDTLSCDIIQCKLVAVDEKGIKIVKLSNLKSLEYTYEQLDKFEVRKLRLGIVPDTSTKEPLKEPTKEECEEATDVFSENIKKRLEELYGKGVGIKILGL